MGERAFAHSAICVLLWVLCTVQYEGSSFPECNVFQRNRSDVDRLDPFM